MRSVKKKVRSNFSSGGYDFGESSRQAKTRSKHSSCFKNHIKSESCSSRSFTVQNVVYTKNSTVNKNAAYKRKQIQLSSSSSDEYDGVIRKKSSGGRRDSSYKKDQKGRKLDGESAFVRDPDYFIYLNSISSTGDKEGKDTDDSEYDSENRSEDSDDDEENKDVYVDLVSDTDTDMDDNGIGAGSELNSDDSSEENAEENKDNYVDLVSDTDTDMDGNGIGAGTELNPEDDDAEENKDNYVDFSDTDTDMDGNGIGAGTELNPDDNNEENAEESEDIQVDVNMDGDSGVEIDVGDEVDPEYKILCQKLNEDGKSSIPKMVSEKGEFVSVKSEEPSLPPSCSKGKSIPVNGFHPLLDECKLKLIPIADESYCKFLGTIGVVGGSLIFITANVVPPVGEHGKLTPSVPEKFPKDCLPCSDGLQLEENNKDSTSDLGNSVKDGLRYCEDPAEKPRQKSCDSQTDEDGLGTDCSRSEYKTKLQKCINMPYDAKEFADKWELASRRNELERVSDHATEKRSRSYLDLHPALAEMVDRAIARRDGCKALLLLRCLFFYNENVAHEGAFMPWKDPSYERMLLDPE